MNMYLSVRNSLHVENVEKISLDQIKHIGLLYDEDLFEHYKKVVFMKWLYKNIENNISFHRRVKRLLKKLDIKLNDFENAEIDSIEPREFTERRALKTIEVPYKRDVSILLQPHAYFFYKGIRAYKRRKILFEKIFQGEIYITLGEVVLYNRDKDEIEYIIPHRSINGIKLKNEYIEISRMNNEPNLYLRYKDNELIFISLKRIVTIKGGEGFANEDKDDFITLERTIESFLSVGQIESKINQNKSIKKKGIKRK